MIRHSVKKSEQMSGSYAWCRGAVTTRFASIKNCRSNQWRTDSIQNNSNIFVASSVFPTYIEMIECVVGISNRKETKKGWVNILYLAPQQQALASCQFKAQQKLSVI